MSTTPDPPSYLDDIHEDIATFAERHLEEDERDEFVDQLLERKGYTRVSNWAPPEPEGQGRQGGGRKPLVKKTQGQGGGGQRKSTYFKPRS